MTKEEFITERTRIISEMLDNPDKYGIYPTTKCFNSLDALFDKIILSNKAKLKEITDADIVKWARQWEYKDKIELSPSDMAAVCLIEAAKAMRDGLIKHQ